MTSAPIQPIHIPQLVRIIDSIRAWFFADMYKKPDASIARVFQAFTSDELSTIFRSSLVASSAELTLALFTPSPTLPAAAISKAQKITPVAPCNIPGIYLHLGRKGDISRGQYIGYGCGTKNGQYTGAKQTYSGLQGVLRRILCDHGSSEYRQSKPTSHYRSLYRQEDDWEDHDYALLLYIHQEELQDIVYRIHSDDMTEMTDIEHHYRNLRRALIAVMEAIFILGGGFYQSESSRSHFADHGCAAPQHGFSTLNRSPGLEAFTETHSALVIRSIAGGRASAARREEDGYANLHSWLLEQFGEESVAAMLQLAGVRTRDRRYRRKAALWREGHYLLQHLTPGGHPRLTYTESLDTAILRFLPTSVQETAPIKMQLQLGVQGKGDEWERPPYGSIVWSLEAGLLNDKGLPTAENVVLRGYQLLDTTLLNREDKQNIFLPKQAAIALPDSLRPLKRVPGENVVFSLQSARAWDQDVNVKRRKPKAGGTYWSYELRFLCFVAWLTFCYALEQLDEYEAEGGDGSSGVDGADD
jgi:hypothetical protein